MSAQTAPTIQPALVRDAACCSATDPECTTRLGADALERAGRRRLRAGVRAAQQRGQRRDDPAAQQAARGRALVAQVGHSAGALGRGGGAAAARLLQVPHEDCKVRLRHGCPVGLLPVQHPQHLRLHMNQP